MTVYWVVWDAAAHWVVDRLEARGLLPAVGELRARGLFTDARPARPNCQTPPSLATLFTGTLPSEHLVTGFDVPGAGGGGIGGELRGFDPSFPAAEPVWRTLGRHGGRSAFSHAPWVFDAAGEVAPYVDAAVEAYSNRIARPDAVRLGPGEAEWTLGGTPLRVAVRDDLTVEIRAPRSGEPLLLTPDQDWRPLRLGHDGAAADTWLGCAALDGRAVLAHTGAWVARVAGGNAPLVEKLRKGACFAGESAGVPYREGLFGPRLVDGGTGSAEDRLLASAQPMVRTFTDAAETIVHGHEADLVVIYLPMTDDLGHELLGWCDERSAAYSPRHAEELWHRVARAYQSADRVLASVLERAGADDTVILGADHGMVGSTGELCVNDVLIRGGFAEAGADGEPDADRSRVFYHAANNGSLWLNLANVPAARAADVMREALDLLRRVRDPATGRTVVRGFTDETGAPLREDPDEPVPGTAFILLHDDYQPTEELSADGTCIRPLGKSAAHIVYTGDERLHAVLAAAGPGIPALTGLGTVENTLPAALVLSQLGLPEASRHALPWTGAAA